jgi:hypothetical protein
LLGNIFHTEGGNHARNVALLAPTV